MKRVRIFPLIIGIILVLFQLMALAEDLTNSDPNVFTNLLPHNSVSLYGFLYRFLFLLSFMFLGIIGTLLIVLAFRPKKAAPPPAQKDDSPQP
jgi:hypothetical protein